MAGTFAFWERFDLKGCPIMRMLKWHMKASFLCRAALPKDPISGNRLPVLSLPLLGPSQQAERPFLSILKFLSEQHLLVGA